MASRGDIDFQKVQPELCKEWLTIPLEKSIDKTPKYIKHKTKGLSSSGSFPVVDQGDSLIAGYIEDKNKTYQGKLPIVIFGDHTRIIKYVDFPFAVGADGTKILKPNDNFNSKFFFHYLKALSVPDLGYSRHFKVLKEIKVPQPPRPEQDRIVAKIDTLMAQVEIMQKSLERIPQLLKDFRQQVLTQAVTGKLTNSQIKENYLGELLNEVKYGTSKKSLPDVEGTPIFRIPNIQDGEINDDDLKFSKLDQKEFDSLKLIEGDVLIIRSNGSVSIVGKSAIIRKAHVNYSYAGYLIRLRCKNSLNPEFLNYSLQSNFMRTQIVDTSRSTSGVNNINSTEIKELRILLPKTIEEQQEIVSRVESLFAKTDSIEQQYQALKTKIDTLPQAILHKAFKGELVEQLESDGDARELLREIEGLKSVTGKKSTLKTKKLKSYSHGKETLGQVAEEDQKYVE